MTPTAGGQKAAAGGILIQTRHPEVIWLTQGRIKIKDFNFFEFQLEELELLLDINSQR